MASAVEQLTNNYSTESPVDFYDFYNAYRQDHFSGRGPNDGRDYLYNDDGTLKARDPYSFAGRLENWWSGTTNSAKAAYDKYLSEYEYRKNKAETSAQNELTWAREDSQIQRLIADYQKAGLNPYALLSGGNLSSGVVSSAANAPSYKRHGSKSSSSEKVNASSAIKILAMLMIAAMK